MSWYKAPSWDVCWDFSKWGRQGGTKEQSGRGRGKGKKWWDQWGQDEANWTPAWWGSEVETWPTPYPPPLSAERLIEAMAAPAKHNILSKDTNKDSLPEQLPPLLEKRLAERQKGHAQIPPPPQKEYEGSLKSLSERHGYGFIACEEVHRIYGRDVYLPKDVVPENTKVLDRLRFMLTLSAKGHPQAKNVSIAAL